MGAGCSSSKPNTASNAGAAAATVAAGPRPGHVYLSYHPADTGDQRAEGGDGAVVRVRDWLTSKGYVVILGESDPDAEVFAATAAVGGDGGAAAAPAAAAIRGRPLAAGVQMGLEVSWQARMQQLVEQCQAFVAVVSEHYGSRPEAARELRAAETSLPPDAGALLPLWHSGPWPPTTPTLEPVLAPLQRVPRGTRPLCRTILEGVMGELLERLQAAGCSPAQAQAPAATPAAAAAGGSAPSRGGAGGSGGGGGGAGGAALDAAAGVAPAPSLEWCFQPGPTDPPESDYAVVRCYTGKLQELADRIAMTVRPTIFDLGGDNFSGDLPLLERKPLGAAAPPGQIAPDAGTPAAGGTLLIDRPHVTLRNGALLLRHDQELRILGAGVVLDTLSVITEQRQGGPRGVALTGGAGKVLGAPYEAGRAMVVLAGAVGVRMLRCQLNNMGPHLAMWLAGGATAALRDVQLESAAGGGAWVRDAGSTLVAQSCRLQRCSGPCLQLEAGGAAQLAGCSVLDSAEHNGVLAGSGARLRADSCVVSGCQAGINLYGGASAELVGCEVVSNRLAGAEVSEPGSRLVAVECKFSMNGQSGLLVATGGQASLTSCTCKGNKAHGALARGQGSACALRQVTLSYNGQAGALLSDGGHGELAGCEATGNQVAGFVVWGPGSAATAADCRLLQNAGGGVALRDGGLLELRGCVVKNNKMAGEVAGAGSRLVVGPGCVMDPAPRGTGGGVVSEQADEAGKKGGWHRR